MKIMLIISVMLTCFSLAAKEPMLAVVNKTDNSISILSLNDNAIVATLPTGTGPHELVKTSDDQYAISTDFVGGDSLTVFDLQNQTVIGTISLAQYPGPHGARVLSDNQTLLVTSGKSEHLVSVDLNQMTVSEAYATLQNTSHMVAVPEQENFAYVTNIRSDSISKINLSQGKIIAQIPTQEMPEAINITSDGSELWYGANKEGLLVAIDPHTLQTLKQWDGFIFPYRVLFSHDEKTVVVPDFRGEFVRFFDRKNKQEIGKLVLPKGAGPQGITLHPTADIAYLSLNLQNKVVAIDIASQQIIAEYPTGNNPDGIVFFYAE